MSKSKDLLTVQEVAQFYGVSTQTIQRRVRESREGKGTFPRPIFGYGRKALWHRRDIENFTETEPGEAPQSR